MSAEVENNKEEEKQPERPVRPVGRLILTVYWQLGFKIVELILAAACMGFIYDPAEVTGMGKTHLHQVGVMYTTYTGSIVIILCIIISRVLKERLSYKTSFVFSLTNAALFLTTGILLTAAKADLTKDHFYHPARYLLNMMTTAIILTFFNAIVFAVDAVITFKMQQDFLYEKV